VDLLSCKECLQEKPAVKFDKMSTKAGKVRRKTCRQCANDGNGNHKKVNRLRKQNLKKCTSCKEIKSFNDFIKQSSSKDGFGPKCKLCWVKRNKIWRNNNPVKYKEMERAYHKENSAYFVEKSKIWHINNRERSNLYRVDRRKTNPEYKIRYYLRSRLYKVIKGNKKVGSFIEDLGCSLALLREHLEKKFQPGMSWENYGLYGWHIDHIIPLVSFDLTDREQFLRACHFSNLQPLWASDNLSKGGKIL
jgi:hypothetical protein